MIYNHEVRGSIPRLDTSHRMGRGCIKSVILDTLPFVQLRVVLRDPLWFK